MELFVDLAVLAYLYGHGATDEERADDVHRRLICPRRTWTLRRWVILTNMALDHVALRRFQ